MCIYIYIYIYIYRERERRRTSRAWKYWGSKTSLLTEYIKLSLLAADFISLFVFNLISGGGSHSGLSRCGP